MKALNSFRIINFFFVLNKDGLANVKQLFTPIRPDVLSQKIFIMYIEILDDDLQLIHFHHIVQFVSEFLPYSFVIVVD